MKLNVILILLISTEAFAASPTPTPTPAKKICLDKFVGTGFEPIDLNVKSPGKIAPPTSDTDFFIQKGRVITDESLVSKKKGESYCKVTHSPSHFMPYKKLWEKNAVQRERANMITGDQNEPILHLSPRPNAEWVAVSYECPYVTSWELLKIELAPLVEVSCLDWGDLLPKKAAKCDTP